MSFSPHPVLKPEPQNTLKVPGIVGDQNEVFRQRVGGNLCIHLADGRALAPDQGGDLAVNVSRRVPGHDGQIRQPPAEPGACAHAGRGGCH